MEKFKFQLERELKHAAGPCYIVWIGQARGQHILWVAARNTQGPAPRMALRSAGPCWPGRREHCKGGRWKLQYNMSAANPSSQKFPSFFSR